MVAISYEDEILLMFVARQNFQQPLDITINEGEKVFFKVIGTHAIHLTGNYVVPNDHGHNDHHEVYDSEEEDEYDLSPSEDEESDELDGLEDPRITEVDDDEEPAPKLVSKPEKKGKNKRSADALDNAESLDTLVSKSIKEEESKESPKLSKKQLKKLKNNKGNAVEVKAEAKEDVKDNGKGDKKVQFAKDLEQGPTGSTPEKAASRKATDGVKVVNGVKIEDKKIGEGPAAKAHHRVEMRYIGKLDDGKVFDCELPRRAVYICQYTNSRQPTRRVSLSPSRSDRAKSSKAWKSASPECELEESVESLSPPTWDTVLSRWVPFQRTPTSSLR